MLTDAKLAANRANAQLSTGPKTAEGKRNSALNRLRHGFYSKSLLLPGEDEQALAAMRNDYIATLKPQNQLELNLVDQIISATWRLYRLARAEELLHCDFSHDAETLLDRQEWVDNDDPSDAEAPPPAHATLVAALKDEHQSLDRLARHEQRLQRTIHRGLRELRLLRQHATDALPESPYLDPDHTPQERADNACGFTTRPAPPELATDLSDSFEPTAAEPDPDDTPHPHQDPSDNACGFATRRAPPEHATEVPDSFEPTAPSTSPPQSRPDPIFANPAPARKMRGLLSRSY
jgi:hypothetical protein